MDEGALHELTLAIDSVMARALEGRLNELTSGMSLEEAGEKLIEAQLAVRISGSGAPPDYSNEWLAPLYLAWYGPSHINMAYTLMTQVIPRHDDTLVKGPSGIHLEDYACGPFAGQFGLVLAASEATNAFTGNRRLSIYGDDDSDPMWNLGKDIWKDFRSEIGALDGDSSSYPSLDSLRSMSRSLLTRNWQNPSARVWLTLFHAAYPDEAGQRIKDNVDALVQERSPRLILLTAYRNRRDQMYDPPEKDYVLVEGNIRGPQLALTGQFNQVTAWRQKIAAKFLERDLVGVQRWKRMKATELLTKNPTNWRPSYFEYVYSLYVRRTA